MQTVPGTMLRAESQQLVPARSREGFPRRALTPVPVSATLAANEVLARSHRTGETARRAGRCSVACPAPRIGETDA